MQNYLSSNRDCLLDTLRMALATRSIAAPVRSQTVLIKPVPHRDRTNSGTLSSEQLNCHEEFSKDRIPAKENDLLAEIQRRFELIVVKRANLVGLLHKDFESPN